MVRNLSLYTSLYTSHFSCTFLCRHVLYCPCVSPDISSCPRLSLFYTSVLGWNARLDFFCFCRFLYDLFCFRKRPASSVLSSVLSPSVSASVGLSVSTVSSSVSGTSPFSGFGIGGGGAVSACGLTISSGLFPALPSHAGLYPFFRLPDTRCALR